MRGRSGGSRRGLLPRSYHPGPDAPGPRWVGAGSTGNREVRAAVPRPGRLFVAGIDGPLLAVGGRAQPVRGHAQAGQVVARDLRALVPEREVVLHGAALVAVALHHDLGLAVVLHPQGVLLQDAAGLVGELGLVVLEVDVGQRPTLAGDVGDREVRARGLRL